MLPEPVIWMRLMEVRHEAYPSDEFERARGKPLAFNLAVEIEQMFSYRSIYVVLDDILK
jgi:hypothetical protein